MKVIIIGSGIASITFAENLRQLSADAKITLLTKENQGYYSRPMLSKGFSQDDIEQSIVIKSFDQLRNNNLCVISGVEVTSINRGEQQVNIKGVDEIESLQYDKLILATGSAAFIPPPFLPYTDNFFLLNSLDDLKIIRKFRQTILDKNKQPHWAIIGGGLIGCEVASDLALAGDQVSLFHAMDRLMERQLVEQDSATLFNVIQSSGIDIRLNQVIKGFVKKDYKIRVKTDSIQSEFDGIIVSCGFKPRIDLAVNAGLNTGRGIKTNQTLQTNDENIYALGDVAELPNGKLYAFVKPIRHQALWLAAYLSHQEKHPWIPPEFNPSAKVNNFKAAYPYLF
ncbi:MAG: NAD(P)/FAD-dependent oxidoreductase [Methylomarinum sp.]|nr:NAD(P)/FAD-dependent oxidoreductase [Methylomarinum sp.]